MALESIRNTVKASVGQTLSALCDEDKLAVAWAVACGKTMAEHGIVVGYVDRILLVEVEDGPWLRQLRAMRGQLAVDLARIAGVTVSEIHFERKRNA